MSGALMGLLGFVSGSAGATGQIAEDQRKYNMEQQAASAQMDRDKNFKRFEYDLQSKRDVALSGLRKEEQAASLEKTHELNEIKKGDEWSQMYDPETKKKLTNNQVKEYEEAGKPMVSAKQMDIDVQEEKEGRAKETKVSQEVDPETGRRLSVAESERRLKAGEPLKAYSVWLQEEKEKVQAIKDDKTFKNSFKTRAAKIATDYDDPAERFTAMEALGSVYGQDERILEEPAIQAHNKMKGAMKYLLSFKEDDKGSFKDALKAGDFTPKELTEAKAILQKQGYDMTKGLGW